MLIGKKVVVGVTGGIAAYKAAELCSQLKKAGAQVRVAMTESATKFVAPLTYETLTQHPVYVDVLERSGAWEMEHIGWAQWGDVYIVVPATANVIGKMAAGLADDAVTTLYLSFEGVVVVAPAMNTRMWQPAAVRRNIETLRQRGILVVDPEVGRLACGETGAGKLAAVEDILAFVDRIELPERQEQSDEQSEPAAAEAAPQRPGGDARPDAPAAEAEDLGEMDKTLDGKVILITSGPTHEYLDPVRFLTNPSSGKMGAALAREAIRRSASVILVSGPVGPASLPQGCARIVKVTTAEQMLRAVHSVADQVDIFVFAAAVSDFRVVNPPTRKIKRMGNTLSIPLVENPDIAQEVGHMKHQGQLTIGFAAETDDVEAHALTKLTKKRLDAIVANDVANPRIGFDKDDNEVTIYLADGRRVAVSQRPKAEVAKAIFDTVLTITPSEQEAAAR